VEERDEWGGGGGEKEKKEKKIFILNLPFL
jgi:hypothetical protein